MDSHLKPNVIYLVAHDLGKELNLYGSPFETPHLNRFARQGVTFHQAVCTSPACSPSRGCAMTGRTAHSNGLAGLANPGWCWSLPDNSPTIVDDFNAHGYETVHAGMEHERQGKQNNHYQTVLESGGWVESGVDAAIQFLESRGRGTAPFYLNIGTNEVHSGQWSIQKKDRTHRRPEELYGRLSLEDRRLPHYLPDRPELREEWEAFGGCVRYWDAQVGRLLEAVDRLGYRDNTLVVLTTDHGVAAHRAKATLYKDGLDISLLMRLPGGAGVGRHVDAMIPNIDLLPTILDFCGVPVREEVEGRSFRPLLTGGRYEPNGRTFHERNFHSDYDPMRSVRTPDYALIENFDPSLPDCFLPDEVPELRKEYDGFFTGLWPETTGPRPRYELFDRRRDPEEFHNVADDPAYAGVLEELKSDLRAWMEETGDPLLHTTDPEEFKRLLAEKFQRE